jgi:hypothetical protein
MDATAVVERSLALIADHDGDPGAIRELLEDGMRFARDGRIARQENYDCFTAPSPP